MNSASKLNRTVGEASPAPSHWAASCTTKECSLHQLSPYIGKLKSVIARDLISAYSKPGHLIADMFCGSGTIPLEAAQMGRRVFASDASKYAIVLTKGKLYAPASEAAAEQLLARTFANLNGTPTSSLANVPIWVQEFFHPQTLAETIQLTELLHRNRQYFMLASLLGILHHQRPGFLSHPSSHLVPYLRSQKFPRSQFPAMYEYRPIQPRLKAKISRALKRRPPHDLTKQVDAIRQSSADSVTLPSGIDCVITSPPYMNALDYGRDNRLRLWFLGESNLDELDAKLKNLAYFKRVLSKLVNQLSAKLKRGGHCVFVVGEKSTRSSLYTPSETLVEVFSRKADMFSLQHIITDAIPDIRRSRRNVAAVKQEKILVFRKNT